jgi:hypothetical protein
MTDPQSSIPRPKETPASWATPPKKGSRCWLYAIGLTATAGGVGYGVAYGQGRDSLQQVEAAALAASTARAQTERTAQAQADQHADRVRLLEGRRDLHRVLLALDERNFGIAREALERGGSSISAVKRAEIESIAGRFVAFEMNVSDDIGAQRSVLVQIVRDLDTALDASPRDTP